ncbi:MAG: hypothetical protein MJY47_02095 [Fibrobacter sp.]|nr:hypothetical protein [Fibrobacter sp.]
MRVLVACEMTQALTKELINLGVDAWSCDILPTIGFCPERHIQDDVFNVLANGDFGALLAIPPCTHLSNAGQKYRQEKMMNGALEDGYNFFMSLYNYPIKIKMIENPLGIVSSQKQLNNFLPGRRALKYSQVVSWEMFGDPRKKRTCLWLQNLPLLLPTAPAGRGLPCNKWFIGSCPGRSVSRSKLSPFFARAMAEQWSPFLRG